MEMQKKRNPIGVIEKEKFQEMKNVLQQVKNLNLAAGL